MIFRKLMGAGGALLAGVLVAFVAVNAVDYFRFHGVIRRLESLPEEQLRALGEAAMKVKTPGRTDRPEGFEALRPIRATLWPGNSDFLVYELKPTKRRFDDDAISVRVRIATSPNNQEISYFTNSWGKQRTKVLWNRNPEFVKKHSPGDRILTISQWPAVSGETRTWIVLKDRILVINASGRTGSDPVIAGSADLDAAGLARIEAEIARLPAGLRGKDYRPKEQSTHPIQLDIGFDPEGKPRPTDISVSNTWVEELRPLLAAVSELGPKHRPIPFIEVMNRPEFRQAFPLAVVQTLAERDRKRWPEINTPWWCVWRKWLE